MRRLRPGMLDYLSLEDTFRATLVSWHAHFPGIAYSFKASGQTGDLAEDVRMTLYRILQESLRNIVKHAKATEIHVTLSKKNDSMLLMIKDNGIGFDPASDRAMAGLGISSMMERARLIQGKLFIESRPGKGTAIKLAEPLETQNGV